MRILGWRLSITLETEFCVDAAHGAMARYGRPEIFIRISQITSNSLAGIR